MLRVDLAFNFHMRVTKNESVGKRGLWWVQHSLIDVYMSQLTLFFTKTRTHILFCLCSKAKSLNNIIFLIIKTKCWYEFLKWLIVLVHLLRVVDDGQSIIWRCHVFRKDIWNDNRPYFYYVTKVASLILIIMRN